VILDITHGFRSLPMLSLLALSFLRVAKGITIKHVLYGAPEARKRENNPVEVFDLEPFLSMLDWANATDRFLETGDARKIAPLISEKSQNPLNGVARGLTQLSEALLFMRAEEVHDAAAKLTRMIAEAKTKEWAPHHAPLKLLLGRIESSTAPMSGSNQLRAQWQQIHWLADHGHYTAAASLTREWMVSVNVAMNNGEIFPVDKEHREVCEKWLNQKSKALIAKQRDDLFLEDEHWVEFLKLWGQVNQLRNDVMHFGMRKGSRSPAAIATEINRLLEQILQGAQSLGLGVDP
jgi:CRISPR-associated DxTHG motif protein